MWRSGKAACSPSCCGAASRSKHVIAAAAVRLRRSSERKDLARVEDVSGVQGAFDRAHHVDRGVACLALQKADFVGMVYVKCEEDGTFKSSVDKFYDQDDLKKWAEATNAKAGDMIFVLSGPENKTRAQLSALRMELATRLGLRNPNEFAPLWVVDFPLLEFDEESNRYHAMHHPFTSPKPEDRQLIETEPGKVRANAYDMVLNGNEIGGGSIRIHDKDLQSKMFSLLGFTPEQAEEQFGFLMNAFQFGAPPHGGLAFGLDRLVAILGGQETIRDFIAFPKNNSGRDVMIDAPSLIDESQLQELSIKLNLK